MFSLEFLSFRYRCRLLWNDCSVAGSYDPPSFFFITIRNWHIKMLSSSSGISSIFLASPTSRKNLFQTCRSYSVFFTVFFLHTRHRKLSGPDGDNTARSRNQSDCKICRIPPAVVCVRPRVLKFWWNIQFILLQHFTVFTVSFLLTNQLVSFNK